MSLTPLKKVLAVLRFFEIDEPEDKVFGFIYSKARRSGIDSDEELHEIIGRVIEKFYKKVFFTQVDEMKALTGSKRFILFLNMIKNEANDARKEWYRRAFVQMEDFSFFKGTNDENESEELKEYLNEIIEEARKYLSKTEFHVLELLKQGKPGEAIADLLGKDESYIRNVRARVIKKLKENNQP